MWPRSDGSLPVTSWSTGASLAFCRSRWTATFRPVDAPCAGETMLSRASVTGLVFDAVVDTNDGVTTARTSMTTAAAGRAGSQRGRSPLVVRRRTMRYQARATMAPITSTVATLSEPADNPPWASTGPPGGSSIAVEGRAPNSLQWVAKYETHCNEFAGVWARWRTAGR